jgi:hypothetical protein
MCSGAHLPLVDMLKVMPLRLINHEIVNTYTKWYCLYDGIYPQWATLSSPLLLIRWIGSYCQEASRKGVEWIFGVLQVYF